MAGSTTQFNDLDQNIEFLVLDTFSSCLSEQVHICPSSSFFTLSSSSSLLTRATLESKQSKEKKNSRPHHPSSLPGRPPKIITATFPRLPSSFPIPARHHRVSSIARLTATDPPPRAPAERRENAAAAEAQLGRAPRPLRSSSPCLALSRGSLPRNEPRRATTESPRALDRREVCAAAS